MSEVDYDEGFMAGVHSELKKVAELRKRIEQEEVQLQFGVREGYIIEIIDSIFGKEEVYMSTGSAPGTCCPDMGNKDCCKEEVGE